MKFVNLQGNTFSVQFVCVCFVSGNSEFRFTTHNTSFISKKKMAEKIANSSLYLHNLILVSVVFFISEVRNVHFRITLNYFHFLEMKLPIFQISRRPCFIIFTLSNDRSRWVHSQLISPKFLHWNTHPKKNSF